MRVKRGTVFVSPGDSLTAAFARGNRLSLAPGVYAAPATIPDGVSITGADYELVHLKGRVIFGSGQTFSHLKLGDAGYSVRNRKGATGTAFEGCRIRGGGGTDVPTLLLGDSDRHAADITFDGCDVECNTGSWNDISLRENAWVGGAHLERITFTGCHIGVSNGVRSGSPRAGLEAYTHYSTVNDHGWRDIRLIGCEWEAADAFTIDLPDTWRIGDGSVRGGPALVRGNLIKGGGRGSSYGYAICVESPEGVVVEDNTLWRASNNTIGTAPDKSSRAGPIFRRNLIDLTVENGIVQKAAAIYVRGIGPQFVENTVIANGGTHAVFKVENTDGAVVEGNTVTTNGAPLWKLWDATIKNAKLSPNTVDGRTV